MLQDVARELRERYRAITACRVQVLEREAHIEVLLPQHQVIVNAAAEEAPRALAAALAKASEQIADLLRRDRSLA
jgi:hypothetical protein